VAFPLEGVRVLALEQFGAGPFGSQHLADLGAEVIKIEDPRTGGDVGRYVPPFATGEDSLFFEAFNRGKKSVSLDLTHPTGADIFRRLVAESDAVYSNMRGDVPEKLGITYSQLKLHNPAIVCCSLSGYGMTGPRRSDPGYDYVVQGLAGWMDITGDPDGPPTKSGLSVVDFSAGYAAALALVTGLFAARRDGVGMDCDISLFDTAIHMLTYPGVWHLNAGFMPTRTKNSAHPSIVPFQVFRAADGWFVIAAAKDSFWRRVTEVIEQPELADDKRFATLLSRQKNSELLIELLTRVFVTRPVGHWIERLRAASVPTGQVNSVEEALRDPQVIARNLVVEADHPLYGIVKTFASPVRVGDAPRAAKRAPRRGEHTQQVLRELLGMDAMARATVSSSGALGPQR
jgi:crotonobetainyl-CoA:carnitine CoA-transferase CaiB-like acyl-CoA transferase